MAYYIETQTHSLAERLFATVAAVAQRAARKHARMRIYKDTLEELRALNDRELTEIGFNRSMLEDIAWEAATTKVPV
jgi:uncharacterized protein YjiS (DUF1127 family)